MTRGRFITLEGGEGAGKSTQAKRLAETLRRRGLEVIETREPGGADGAERLRDVLLDAPKEWWDPVGEALLLAAARRNHLQHTIRPALDRGAWVICDRFADSTMAYQGHGHGVPEGTLETLYDVAAGPFGPDLTLILDVPAETGLARAASRGTVNRFEALDRAFHLRVHLGFHDIAAREPERCMLIDALADQDTVASRVLAAVDARIAEWAADADAVDGSQPVVE
ncbi:dTMP kinase [Roseospira marina]|uniref:Thymidylate kinase n=1 Tax=Roseospira marina TaxID=140057 RepID=A0A5M6IHI9_9PROT|nr:dTMP kinase [Roseospira marina]KAA5607249.1 dTMP kinase [Roseospira marina]MBB4312599.1 dTMP kinase [Roseospira marina]MBB5085385.1 dTMP kinase [Roseospira marina]